MARNVISIISFISLLSARAGTANAENSNFNFVRHVRSLAPRAYSEAATLPQADVSVPFGAKTPRRKSKRLALSALRGRNTSSSRSSPGNTVVLDGSDSDFEYLTNVTIGGQKFSLSVDTGSSDTWVIQQGFSCFDLDGNPQSQDEDVCAFGSPGFNPNASKTFAPFPGASFNITFSDGEVLLGPVGVDNVNIGGLCVEKQVVPIPTQAAYLGDGINSGIITSPFALDRGSSNRKRTIRLTANLGFLAFGGIAPVPSTANNNTVLDTGTTVNFFPSPVAAAYAAKFSPPAVVDPDTGLYTIACNATDANNNTVCITGTQDGGADQGGNVFILGDVFLHNVVTTFNPVDGEVIITQRAPY
ncbi:acid protease [Mycena olivaceomarginata]|nr:acid protease [Mycena olivaceomarginata]